MDIQMNEQMSRQPYWWMNRHLFFKEFIIQMTDSFMLLSDIVVIFHGQKWVERS